ncbi:galactokinase [Lyngbya confervoides]|uniref:Galactokinase n=1 Tax=Lyngbya confervoides BDU141951 TaxID=1574623 RepID=A0ABD4SZQ7_9CYAN|nr:galactokinase [Lyngbya confervoides]MCM1981830.1 galactokinase [Lyngbya confervoides BDU141951]
MSNSFQAVFGTHPLCEATAQGRVNLLGEHTDYNEGFVLPTLIPLATQVAIGPRSDPGYGIYSTAWDKPLQVLSLSPPFSGSACYVLGSLHLLQTRGVQVPPINVWIDSSIPMGRGLSSSAALVVALLRSLRTWLHLNLADLELAQLAQQVEHQYAGVRCGIMDPLTISVAHAGDLFFLDTRSLEYQHLPWPAADLLILDSGISRDLARSGYNQRRLECEQAAQGLQVPTLRSIQSLSQLRGLPPLLYRRAKHVYTENQRVLKASQGGSADQLGKLMNASHHSLKVDFQVSTPELDALVNLLQRHPAVWGARLTGAGFGGACVALVEPHQAPTVAASVLAQYPGPGQLLLPDPGQLHARPAVERVNP